MKKFRGVFLKNDKEIGLMREANRIVSTILDELAENVKPGVSTMLFEDICRSMCDQYGVRPAFLGYQGFPFALCCSVNEEIVHGFPSKERILNEGDIVSVDMGVVYEGFYGDSARTFAVGAVSDEAKKLMDVTRESLYKGIDKAVPGNNLYDISAAIQSYVEGFGFGIVRRFVGHGIGSHLHEKPEIPNFVPKGMPGVPLKAGMVLAIEPMVTVGSHEVEVLEDKWTAVTKDRKLSAHFEHTIAITSDGPMILSLSD
nr:type I methionyl aminopeptidase [uncultured Pseudodesulfovibrio sp.]